MRATQRPSTRYRRLVTAGLAMFVAAGVAQARDEGYGYYRILEGEAIRYGVTDDERNVNENEPLLEGDRITVAGGSRLEVVLPDFSRLRLGENTDVDFERLRASDNRADEYRIRLFEGELQIAIDEQPDEFLLELDNATVYLLEGGSYRISGGVDFARVLVREGYAEILTEAGSAVARSGEEVSVEGFSNPQVFVEDAGRTDDLERWADANEREAERINQRSNRYVDDELGYAAADLEREGEWMDVGGSYAWRPLDRPDWRRPYYSGYWYDTPYGIHWVSQYRWGWLTSHYGYWDFNSHFGWVWYPGAAYSPAWVHWYWGPSYVGWIPSGYYYRHYGHYGYNYYGYVGHGWFGHHGHHNHWTFHDRHRFGHHQRKRFYYDDVDVVPRRELEAGIITTDTRGLRREAWNRVDESNRILTRNAARTRGGLTYQHPEDLPDAVSYVTRSAGKLDTSPAGDTRLGPPEQVARRTDSGGIDDTSIAGGLVVQRGRSTSTGTGASPQAATTERETGRLWAQTPTRSTTGVESRGRPSTGDRVASEGGRERIVLPGPPAVLQRGRADEREVARRTDEERGRVERRDGWQIERRSVPERDATRAESAGDRSERPSQRPSSGRSVYSRSASDRPTSAETPRAGYDRRGQRPSTSQATPRSTPTRRYDRPTTSSRSSGSSVRGRSSSRPSSGTSSSTSSRGSSGSSRSSSSGSGSSRSSSSSSDSGSSSEGSASRSRSGG